MEWYWWLLLAGVLAVAEVSTLDLTFMMIAAGALAGAAASGLGAPLVLQAVVAAAVALLMLAVVRPTALKHLRTPTELRSGVAALEGAEALVLERVDRHGGRVKISGEVWSARSYDPTAVIEPGKLVDVIKIEGATALVYPVEP